MTTYYEILQISPTATTSEIRVAYKAQYNHWRRLVTHHDPDTVNKANQALQWLERVRATLTDPAQRETYDASIGLRGPVGGLADPQARPQVRQVTRPTPPPPRPRPDPQTPPASAATGRVDAWLCPQCQTANDIGAQFCKSCGHQIGTECVKCEESMEVGAGFCPTCGANQKQARQEKELEQAEEVRREQELAQKYVEERAIQKAGERLQVLFYPLILISLDASLFLTFIFRLHKLVTVFLFCVILVLTLTLLYRAITKEVISQDINPVAHPTIKPVLLTINKTQFLVILTLLWAVAIFGGATLMLFLARGIV